MRRPLMQLLLGLAAVERSAALRTVARAAKSQLLFQGNETEAFAASGAGVLTKMEFQGGEGWLVAPVAAGFGGTTLRVYVDGASAPSVECPLYTLIATEFLDECGSYHECEANCSGHRRGRERDCPYGGGPWGTSLMGKSGVLSGIYNTRRIPYGDGIRVTLQLPPGPALASCSKGCNMFWTIKALADNMPRAPVRIGPIELPASARLRLVSSVVPDAAPLQFVPLYSSPAGKAGLVHQVSIAAESGNFNFMEACVRLWLDGSNMTLISSGTEDYFDGTYYFDQGLFMTETAGLTQQAPLEQPDPDPSPFPSPQSSRISAFRVHTEDPLVYERSMKLLWRNGESCLREGPYDVTQQCAVPAPDDNLTRYHPAGSPQPSNITTRIWVYEWPASGVSPLPPLLTKSDDDDDMASLRRRTLEPLLPTATHIGSAVSAAKQAASSLAANGSWPDIWYGDVSHGANDHWQPASHLSRLSSMVTPLVACNVSGNSLCNDTSLGAKVSAALNFWLTRNPW